MASLYLIGPYNPHGTDWFRRHYKHNFIRTSAEEGEEDPAIEMLQTNGGTG